MNPESPGDTSALEHVDHFHEPWGIFSAFILIILAIIWLWRTHARNIKERERAAKLCEDSVKSKS